MNDKKPVAKLFVRRYIVNCDGKDCPRHAMFMLEDFRGRQLSKLCEKCLRETIYEMRGEATFAWEVPKPSST